ncbi:MAG: hypothetical protein A3D31_05550 [Candidatus Fluviicola riflensis]|nr:MAG: hypothetical protein CHH17_09465 [Candidatus Fluviicola riflensis]OGS79434.1 MAG: hypothetical protein A3D31_05550 [Candidatus Fluviicola riflensis]OGS86866.1 MAG: hypothetical protein A2724_05010 [Fluviicola sp. RIFCSPHIGHO2_01_FULL_43_53]OGS89656.1 MAG: hypothetical protein A3E30_01755 [Fluviicola sp. RIFCSPHIGHO2_12_FULL_43_24]
MCFSASASFIAGAALTVVGVASMSQVRKPAHMIFASLPLIFAIQQICEGFVWLSLSNLTFFWAHTYAKYAFLFFAQIIWPFWIPLAFLSIERVPRRRKIMRYFLFAGIAVSLLLTGRLIFSAAVAEIDGCHIAYKVGTTKAMQVLTGILYICSIVIAPFFSSWRTAIALATVNVVSLLITTLFFEVYLVSVWCFFAALQSVLVFFVMREIRRKSLENT